MPFVLGEAATQLTLAVTQTATSLSVSFTVPAGTQAEVCLPVPHSIGASGGAMQMTMDGKTVATVVRGRMLCPESDAVAGSHVVARE